MVSFLTPYLVPGFEGVRQLLLFSQDAIMVENMHDIPYLNRQVGPEIVASMSVVCNEVKKEANNLPCGIQILAGANKEALAVAKAAGLQFIRAEGFVFSHIADEGTMNSDAGELLRYRKHIEADDIIVFTDIKKKHRYVSLLLHGYDFQEKKSVTHLLLIEILNISVVSSTVEPLLRGHPLY